MLRTINRFFVCLFENDNNDHIRDSFDKYYMPLTEIKYFTILIENKPFFEQPVKNKQKPYEKIIEISANYDCKTEFIRFFILSKLL